MWAFPGKIYDEITAHEAIANQLRLGGHIQVDVVALGLSVGRLVFGAWQVDGCDLVERIEPG